MTIETFDQLLGYLLKLALPPNDDISNAGDVLDVLLKHTEEVRGSINQEISRQWRGSDEQ